MKWMMTKDDVFSVKSMYKVLKSGLFQSFPWQMVQRSCATKGLLFLSESGLGKVFTLNQLQRMGFSLAKKCYLCQECKESMNTPSSTI